MRVAVVHDWLVVRGGAERVLEQILHLFPEATLYSLVDFLPPEERAFLGGRKPVTSFIQHLALPRGRFRAFLPLMPLAIGQWNFSGYDLVISSSHCVVKGIKTRRDQLHVSYIHTPMRYVWDLKSLYLQQMGLNGVTGLPVRLLLTGMRQWDRLTANRVDCFIANSAFVAQRIQRCYGRQAQVVHPPVACDDINLSTRDEGFYLTVSRMVPYKRMDLIVAAFRQLPDKRLVVIGNGPEMGRIRQAAEGCANITLLGHQPDGVVYDYMARCRAFLFAALEDFGIVPLEAQAAGKPVVAYAAGGAFETMGRRESNPPVAYFFHEQSARAIAKAVLAFEGELLPRFSPHACRDNATRYSATLFRERFSQAVQQAREAFAHSPAGGGGQ